MSPVAVPADRRFHRAHVKPARRRAAWRTVVVSLGKYGVLATLVGALVVRTHTFLTTSPRLAIARIEPAGNQRVSSEAIRAMLADLRGENILQADLEAGRTRLLEASWVRDATLHRSLPGTIEVSVQERSPVAVSRINGGLYLVDDRGATIDAYGPSYSNLDLPIVDGFGGKPGDRATDDTRAELAARLITALRQKPSVAARLSQVNVSNPHNVRVLLNNDPAELRLGDDHFLARLESYLSLSEALHQRVPEIDYVDLRFDGRVFVRPVAKAGKTAGAPRPAVATAVHPDDADQH
jgi:cell division protein FtsQ